MSFYAIKASNFSRDAIPPPQHERRRVEFAQRSFPDADSCPSVLRHKMNSIPFNWASIFDEFCENFTNKDDEIIFSFFFHVYPRTRVKSRLHFLKDTTRVLIVVLIIVPKQRISPPKDELKTGIGLPCAIVIRGYCTGSWYRLLNIASSFEFFFSSKFGLTRDYVIRRKVILVSWSIVMPYEGPCELFEGASHQPTLKYCGIKCRYFCYFPFHYA